MVDDVTVLVVPDGAAEPVGDGPTCLEAASTPTLDRLAAVGQRRRVATIPDGLAAGTEVGLAGLLGVELSAALPRGRVEAAAAGVALGADEAAWRCDLVPPRSPAGTELTALNAALLPLGARLVSLGAHRLLLVGPAAWGDAPAGPQHTDAAAQPARDGPFGQVVAAAATVLAATGTTVWPWGRGGGEVPPRVPDLLGCPVQVVSVGGAPAGIAALLGCTVRLGGAEQGVETVAEAPAGSVVLLHDPAPDDAGHARDRAGKIAALERLDRDLLTPLVALLGARSGQLIVSPDHGCDPATGRHSAAPVPGLICDGPALAAVVAGAGAGSAARLTERAVRAERLVAAPALLPAARSRARRTVAGPR